MTSVKLAIWQELADAPTTAKSCMLCLLKYLFHALQGAVY